MTSDFTTSPQSVMLATLYVLLEVGYFLVHTSTSYHKSAVRGWKNDNQATGLAKWKCELASRHTKGVSAVDNWVECWFEHIDVGSRFKDVKRGNVETYLAERLFGLELKEVLANPTKHHVLIGLVSELERRRNRRFPSGYNTALRLSPYRQDTRVPYRPLFFVFMAILYWLIEQSFDRSQTASVARSFRSSEPSKISVEQPRSQKCVVVESKPHVNSTVRAIPESSLAMVSSLSNLSSIGLCIAPPLRTRQRSRTIDLGMACTQIPASSLAMMSSLSNLSSIGMCAAPPLRTRQRSRTATSVVGYASAIPFAISQKVFTAA